MSAACPIPMWHRRFTDARNHLSSAAELMEQAYFEDRHNPVFDKFHQKLSKLLTSVSRQMDKNYTRGRREGWLPKK